MCFIHLYRGPAVFITVEGLRKSKTRGRQGDRVRTSWSHFCLQLQYFKELHRLQDRRSSRRNVSFKYSISRSAHFTW